MLNREENVLGEKKESTNVNITNIVVIGSANMDISNYIENAEFPDVLTSEGSNYIIETQNVLGGKGANQAVSAALQSIGTQIKVSFIGCVGEDEAGIDVLVGLRDKQIDFSGVKVIKNVKTDGRIIYVDKNGNNRMFGYGDCIKQLIPQMLQEEKINKIMKKANIVMIQMKMPAETVEYVIDYCKRNNKTLLIDPTPIEKSSLLAQKDLIGDATYLTPNEEEAFALAMYEKGYKIEDLKELMKTTSRSDRLEIIKQFVEKYPNVIATLGDEGVMYYNRGVRKINPFSRECIDSTGAGDTFNGAFITAIARGEDLDTAIEFALADCAEKIKHKGAQNGMQTLEETKEYLDKMKSHN